MSQTSPGGAIRTTRSSTRPSAWAAGWSAFAGTMMAIGGAWWIITGLVALLDDEFFVVTEEWIFRFDLTTWGWTHLVLGTLLVAAGTGVFSGAVWARTIGVIVAGIAMLVAFAWMPYYPIWGILFIAISTAVIWSLTAHGRDIAEL